MFYNVISSTFFLHCEMLIHKYINKYAKKTLKRRTVKNTKNVSLFCCGQSRTFILALGFVILSSLKHYHPIGLGKNISHTTKAITFQKSFYT